MSSSSFGSGRELGKTTNPTHNRALPQHFQSPPFWNRASLAIPNTFERSCFPFLILEQESELNRRFHNHLDAR